MLKHDTPTVSIAFKINNERIRVCFNRFKARQKDNRIVAIVRGQEPGGAPRVEGEVMSADECKQHDCDPKTFVCSQKCTKLKHIKVFYNFFCNHLFDFFWNVNLKYELHLAKLQNGNKF